MGVTAETGWQVGSTVERVIGVGLLVEGRMQCGDDVLLVGSCVRGVGLHDGDAPTPW